MNSKPVLIVSHDAGGAYLLSKWCRSMRRSCFFEFYLKGPAVEIFRSIISDIALILDPDFSKYQCIITSTGWQTDFEVQALSKAQDNSIFTIAYLDHWSNYLARFKLLDEVIYPDEIWCGDSESLSIAKNIFSSHVDKFRFIRNRHALDVINSVKKISLNKDTVLVCLEPIRDGYSLNAAYGALSDYLVNNYKDGQTVVLRDHPSSTETGIKILTDLLSPFFNVKLSVATLEYDLAKANAVFGYQSSVLVYAASLGIPTFSFYPSSILEKLLPHKIINYI